MQILKDFYAVITGASDGLGFAMARALLKNGAHVALASRPGDKLKKAVAALEGEGLNPVALAMDVRDERSIIDAAAYIEKLWGKVDMLVNNAGLGMGRVNPDFATKNMPFFEIDTQGFHDMIETNLMGYFMAAKAFVPMMIRQGKGRIVTISTSLSTMKREYMSPYGASRAGSEALSEIMAKELKEYGIDVNVLLPGGAVDTGLIPEASREEFMKRPGILKADIMEKPILFLASDQAAGMTGERIIATEFEEWLKIKGLV